MFPEVSVTWNPVVGCQHHCCYCYAGELALGKLKHSPRYHDGFKPKLIEKELRRRFNDALVFVSDMGDLWGDWVPPEWIEKVLVAIRRSPETTFLMLTKNPSRYHEFLNIMPPNVILGATIETNQRLGLISQAPPPLMRAAHMMTVGDRRRMISIEPIMKFDLFPFVGWLKRIAPEFIYVGYDNHGHRLAEPALAETQELIKALSKFTEVRPKTLRGM